MTTVTPHRAMLDNPIRHSPTGAHARLGSFGRRPVTQSATSMTNVPVAGPALAVMVAMPGLRATRWSPSTATIEGRLLV